MRPVLLAACLALACQPLPGAPDASSPDAGDEPDAGSDPFRTCEATCTEVTLVATIDGASEPFDRVQFGFTHTGDGRELYFEAYSGGDPACPTAQSPTPRMALVVSGIREPTDATPQTRNDGLAVTLFDFAGALTDEPLVRATTVTLTPRAFETCEAEESASCERFFAFDLDATLPGGRISGHGFARYCASLDD